jgi:peptide deformylase
MKILTYPNPILTNKSSEVDLPLSKEDEKVVRKMFEIVKGIGVGLAAPQIGINKRYFIVHLSEDESLTKLKKNSPDFVVINPKILFQSEVESQMIEGCLSFPEEYWKIWRSSNVQVEFTTISNQNDFIDGKDPKYKKEKFMAKDWLARIFLHEYDHLDGKLFIKRGGIKIKKEDLDDENSEIID